MMREKERVERLGVREKRTKIRRMTRLERCVGERQNFILNSFIYFEPVNRFVNRSDMIQFRSFGDGTCS